MSRVVRLAVVPWWWPFKDIGFLRRPSRRAPIHDPLAASAEANARRRPRPHPRRPAPPPPPQPPPPLGRGGCVASSVKLKSPADVTGGPRRSGYRLIAAVAVHIPPMPPPAILRSSATAAAATQPPLLRRCRQRRCNRLLPPLSAPSHNTLLSRVVRVDVVIAIVTVRVHRVAPVGPLVEPELRPHRRPLPRVRYQVEALVRKTRFGGCKTRRQRVHPKVTRYIDTGRQDESIDMEDDLKLAVSICEMTMSIRSSWISIWDILSRWLHHSY